VAKGARRRAADRRQPRGPGGSVAIIPREASDQRGAGPLKNAWRAASVEARAKLQFALSRYKPRRFDGPVEILASPERELDSSLADLLPRRRSQLVFEEHGEISTAKAASLMQMFFKAALAGEGSPPPQEPSLGSMSLAAREA